MIGKRMDKKVADGARRLALRSVVYFSGQEQVRLDASPCNVAKPLLLILAKSCYQEEIESFPIKSASELKQLLELQRPKDALTRYFIGPYINNQRLVYKIFIDPNYAVQVSGARLLVPETVMLSEFAPLGFTSISLYATQTIISAQHLWYYKGPKQGLSVLQGGLVQTEDAARVMLGVSSAAPTQQWRFSQYLNVISENWWRLPLGWWLAARNVQEHKEPLPWPKLLGAGIVISIFYGLVSSSYLHFANEWRAKQLVNMSNDVTQRLGERESFDGNLSKLSALKKAGEIEDQQLHAWNIIAFLNINDIDIDQISANNEYLEFSGEADSATDLVTQLNSLAGVARIEFISPVRRGRSGETFRLRIQLVAN
jgi:hypothetical protein